jgi:L-fuculose-phosphate aldolase
MRTADLVAQLIDAGRYAVGRGLVNASGGNLSARLQDGDGFVLTGTGTWLDRLSPSDFAIVSSAGEHLSGPPPSVEWRLHQRTYEARPDVGAIVHLHPQHAVLVDAIGEAIRCITLDHAYYLGRVVRIPFLPSGTDELARAAADAVAEGDNALVLAHHGCSALGESVPMALRRAANIEEAATMTYRLLLLGDRDSDFPPEYRGRIIDV